MSRLTRWSLVAGRIADIAFPALHAPYIVGTYLYMDSIDFVLSILSISPGGKSREEISSYIKEERINFSVHVGVFLNIELD